MADIYDGENYDARKESNWTTSDFDDSDWLETDVNNYFTGDMLAFIGQPVRVRTSLEQKPKSIVIYNGINPDASTYGQINIVRMFAASQPFSLLDLPKC
jgi:alpha-L-rhamnosidase